MTVLSKLLLAVPLVASGKVMRAENEVEGMAENEVTAEGRAEGMEEGMAEGMAEEGMEGLTGMVRFEYLSTFIEVV